MPDQEPVTTKPLSSHGTTLPPWDEVRWRLEEAQFYWLATARPDGRPHVMPVLAVWVDGALHFTSSPAARKSRNLAQSSNCVIAIDSDDLHLVLEGEAEKVRDEARLRRVAEVYASKYGWQVSVRHGAFYADGAPTAGPPPYDVYELTMAKVFGFGTDESFSAVRWSFWRGHAAV